jgi:hypothetical protein
MGERIEREIPCEAIGRWRGGHKVGAGEYFEAPPHGTRHCDFKYWDHDKLETP